MTDTYYCIPDIHGCSGLLKQALNFIYEAQPAGCKIIFLGDYIDRGPDNKGALEIVMNPPENYEFVCLLGNHEQIFLNNCDDKINFFDDMAALDIAGITLEGNPTLRDVHEAIDPAIISWMRDLKLFHIEDKNVFAHAFYNDQLKPEEQIVFDCIWERMGDSEKYHNDNQGFYLTHGHTPRKNGPIKSINRVNLDAGVYAYHQLVIGEYRRGIQGPVCFHRFEIDPAWKDRVNFHSF